MELALNTLGTNFNLALNFALALNNRDQEQD
jgi:hypothetical protein